MILHSGQFCGTGQTRARRPYSAATHWQRTSYRKHITTCNVVTKRSVGQLEDSTASITATADPPARQPSLDSNAALTAATSALTAVTLVTYHELSQVDLPALRVVVQDVAGVLVLAATGAAAAVGASKLLLGDKFHLELHRGRVYVQFGVPSTGPAVNPAECIITRPTGDVRGNGAYATAFIPAGSHIADYSGQILDKAAFFNKYPDGVGNYAMAIDQEWVIDAADHVSCTSEFHPVHMNHSRPRANVVRYYHRRAGRVAFFAAKDIQPGEELLYDYGRAYWQGREHMELP